LFSHADSRNSGDLIYHLVADSIASPRGKAWKNNAYTRSIKLIPTSLAESNSANRNDVPDFDRSNAWRCDPRNTLYRATLSLRACIDSARCVQARSNSTPNRPAERTGLGYFRVHTTASKVLDVTTARSENGRGWCFQLSPLIPRLEERKRRGRTCRLRNSAGSSNKLSRSRVLAFRKQLAAVLWLVQKRPWMKASNVSRNSLLSCRFISRKCILQCSSSSLASYLAGFSDRGPIRVFRAPDSCVRQTSSGGHATSGNPVIYPARAKKFETRGRARSRSRACTLTLFRMGIAYVPETTYIRVMVPAIHESIRTPATRHTGCAWKECYIISRWNSDIGEIIFD